MKRILASGILVAGLAGCTTTEVPLSASLKTVMVDDNRAIVYPVGAFSNVSAGLFTLNGQPLTSWTNCTVTNLLVSSNWSVWVATTNVDIGGWDITNAATVYSTNATVETLTATAINATTSSIASLNATTANIDSLAATTNSFSFATIATGTITYIQAPGGVLLFKD